MESPQQEHKKHKRRDDEKMNHTVIQ